ncbi:hypothetical protein ACLK19_25645 [Escherichia coli]
MRTLHFNGEQSMNRSRKTIRQNASGRRTAR